MQAGKQKNAEMPPIIWSIPVFFVSLHKNYSCTLKDTKMMKKIFATFILGVLATSVWSQMLEIGDLCYIVNR